MSAAPEEPPGTGLEPFDRSADDHVEVMRIGDVQHILRFVGQCDTCRSPYRTHIEVWSIQNQRLAWIHDQLVAMAGEESVPSYDSLRRHFLNKHSAGAAYANQQLADEMAAVVGKKIDETVQQRVDVLTLASKVVDIRGQDFLSGDGEKPSDSLLIASMNILRTADRDTATGSMDADALMSVINRILAYANDHVADRTAFTEALLADPVLIKFDRVMRGLPAEADEG